MNKRAVSGVPLVLGFIAILAVARAIATQGVPGEVIFLIAPIVPLVALTVAARHHDDHDPTAWWLLAWGMALLFAAELFWSWLEVTDPDRFPSPGDYLHAVGLLLIVCGLWRTVTRLSEVGDRTGFVDATVLALAAGTSAWLFLVEPGATHEGLSGAEEAWTVLPLALDVAMLAMAARLAFVSRGRPHAYVFIYLAVAGAMIVDLIDSLLELGVRAEVGRLEDPIFILCFGFWAAAALQRGPVPHAPVAGLRTLSGRRAALLIACLCVPLITLIAQELRGQELSSVTLVVIGFVTLAIGTLVVYRIGGLIVAARDLATAKGQERFAALVENASDVIVTVDQHLVVAYASPSAKAAWGRDPDEIVGRPFIDLVAADDAAVVASQLERVAGLPEGSRLTMETRVARSGGGDRICDVVASRLPTPEGGEGISITLRDVTDQRALEDELRTRAFNDELTGLANRALFMNRVEHALASRGGRSDQLAILYLDLDDFKQVNDGLGHTAGDELLAAVGQRLKECVRPGDTVARLGGDEFAILLEDGDGVGDAIRVANRIQEVLALPLPAGTLHLGVRASVGIAVAHAGSTPHDLLRDADIAMYQAKSSSGASFTVFDPSMHTTAATLISLRSALERAIDQGEFHLVYQPIFDLGTMRISGAEALLRWEQPERGPISPGEFIPIAEQSGSIREIGRWVLERACHDAAGWVARGHDLRVSVNASAVQLQDPTFADQVEAVLDASGLASSSLTLEVTETAMMDDPEATSVILATLRSLDIKVAIDDFGTGYCSLAYLKRFAIDSLKIDQAFVSEIGPESEDLLAHNILRLADSLGVPAVAEGIEHEAQLDNLVRSGCASGQGFFLARPMRNADFEVLLGAAAGARRHPEQADA